MHKKGPVNSRWHTLVRPGHSRPQRLSDDNPPGQTRSTVNPTQHTLGRPRQDGMGVTSTASLKSALADAWDSSLAGWSSLVEAAAAAVGAAVEVAAGVSSAAASWEGSG